ncbi:MAG: hypothetical protein MK538_08010 [Planctomycetes bacterium]|nr:hypothetical protein [Planctomycetota bacterium]
MEPRQQRTTRQHQSRRKVGVVGVVGVCATLFGALLLCRTAETRADLAASQSTQVYMAYTVNNIGYTGTCG